MSSLKVPGNVKRSRSFSHIPLPNRDSRGKSLTRQTSFVRTSTIPTADQQSSIRKGLVTPKSDIHRSAKKSPFCGSSIRKDNRPISDKKWQHDQLFKVRKFFQDHPGKDIITANIRPGLSLETFIEVMNCLFQELDPRIKIMKANYLDDIPCHLKILKYPGTPKQSLMKTANTPHSWPYIVAIFSWLIDMINAIEKNTKKVAIAYHDNKIDQIFAMTHIYITKIYHLWNAGENEQPLTLAYGNNLMDIHGISITDLGMSQEKTAKLKETKESFILKEVEVLQKIKDLTKQKEKIVEACTWFHQTQDQFKNDIKNSKTKMMYKIDEIDKKISDHSTSLERIKNILACQKYTSDQKREFELEIEYLKHTLKLKRERHITAKEERKQCTKNLIDIKQKFQTLLFEHNNYIKKLNAVCSAFKMPLVREDKFTEPSMLDELDKMIEMKLKVRMELETELKHIDTKLLKLVESKKTMTINYQSAILQIQDLERKERGMNDELNNTESQYGRNLSQLKYEIEMVQNSREALKKSYPNLQIYKNQLQDAQSLNLERFNSLEELKQHGLNFMVNMLQRILNNLNEIGHQNEAIVKKYLEIIKLQEEKPIIVCQLIGNQIKELRE